MSILAAMPASTNQFAEHLESARKTLRASSRASIDATLTAPEARAVFEELQRLQQSNDRLRRQNKRVRRRLDQAGGEADQGDVADDFVVGPDATGSSAASAADARAAEAPDESPDDRRDGEQG